MKSIIIFLWSLLPFASFAQSANPVVSISKIDCRSNSYDRGPSDTVRFYKLPENALALEIKYKAFSPPVTTDQLSAGNYRVIFQNTFNQKVSEEIKISGQDTNRIELCATKLKDYPQNTLAKFQENDSLVINFASFGCFHSLKNNIIITKRDGVFHADSYAENNPPVYKKRGYSKITYRIADLVKSVVMNKEQLQAFLAFENELNYIRDGGCTTVDSYSIISKYLNVNKNDGTCRWDGFHHLYKSLFL